jgi:predicted nucleotidyltransferase
VRRWAAELARSHPEVSRIGYFGSYARGDWGPGSDLDLVVIVRHSDEPFAGRAARWDATGLPVPADLLVYTEDEWDGLLATTRFHRTVTQEGIWVHGA